MICEGPTKSTRVHLYFTGREPLRENYMSRLCADSYEDCLVYQMAYRKWE